jgi:hypothetical protein
MSPKSLKPILIKQQPVETPQCSSTVDPPGHNKEWRKEHYRRVRPGYDPNCCQRPSVYEIDGKPHCRLHSSSIALAMWCEGLLVEPKRPPVYGCSHPDEERIKGGYDGKNIPRYPLRYGSAEVEICKACDAYRLNVHSPDKWYPGPYELDLKERLRQQEEE